MKVVKGDLFDYSVIAHGCNAKGIMGAGIAKAFRDKFPKMHYTYSTLCDQDLLGGGDVHAWKENGVLGFNIISQIKPGAAAKTAFIEAGLETAMRLASAAGSKELAIPLIGCGIGGLNWEDHLEPIVNELDDSYRVELVVVTL